MDLEEEPFVDNPEPILLEQGFYKLEPLAYIIDNPSVISIIGRTSEVAGKLEANIIPVDTNGIDEYPEELISDEPMDLVGNRLDFIVEITKAFELPEDFCKDVMCEYSFYLDEQKYTTTKVLGKNSSPLFDYRKHHIMEYCSENFVNYLLNDTICFKLFAYPDVKRKEEPKRFARRQVAQNESPNVSSVTKAETSMGSASSSSMMRSFD